MSQRSVSSSLLRRRALGVALVAVPAFWCGARAQTPARLRPTPAQTEGPFYPLSIPADSDFDLLKNGPLPRYAKGHHAWIEGTVTDTQGHAIGGATVEIWQCDEGGNYHHPGAGGRADAGFQGFGRVSTDGEGRYRFRTIRPVAYAGRSPHIHMKVKLGARELLTTQLYDAGAPGNANDGVWRRLDAAQREAVSVPFVPGNDGLRAVFPVVIAA